MILCYHHGDLDGICSAAIVLKCHGPENVKCVSVQYGENTWNADDIDQSELVYVVDFTFKDMENLVSMAGKKLVWLDHHKTAMEEHKEIWGSQTVLGFRDLSHSGCGLTWAYCFKSAPPKTVCFVEDMDLWIFGYPETRAFCSGLGIFTDSPVDGVWDYLLGDKREIITQMIQFGELLIKSRDKRVKYLFESGVDVNFMGYTTRLINSISDISVLGEFVYSKPEYELAVIWHMKGDKIIVSLRSNTVDCSEIAKLYGGGGHPGAAGFSICNVGLIDKLFTEYPAL